MEQRLSKPLLSWWRESLASYWQAVQARLRAVSLQSQPVVCGTLERSISGQSSEDSVGLILSQGGVYICTVYSMVQWLRLYRDRLVQYFIVRLYEIWQSVIV